MIALEPMHSARAAATDPHRCPCTGVCAALGLLLSIALSSGRRDQYRSEWRSRVLFLRKSLIDREVLLDETG